MPITQYSSIVDYYTGVTIKLGTSDTLQIKRIGHNISNLLSQTNRTHDYSIVLPATLLEKSQQEQKMFNLIMGSIAGLSLLVGGIGIMNVMLAHLAEQTREIGLRLSVGAQKVRIIQLFLSYSLMLAVTGTFIGIITGMGLTLLIQQYAEWPIKFSFFSLTVGPLFSILAGAAFGLYPAIKASEIQPNTALRQV
jgi:putative ABC transport system permease protein